MCVWEQVTYSKRTYEGHIRIVLYIICCEQHLKHFNVSPKNFSSFHFFFFFLNRLPALSHLLYSFVHSRAYSFITFQNLLRLAHWAQSQAHWITSFFSPDTVMWLHQVRRPACGSGVPTPFIKKIPQHQTCVFVFLKSNSGCQEWTFFWLSYIRKFKINVAETL